MCGGVSDCDKADIIGCKSSPHAWGCFYQQSPYPPPAQVFPTCVGVFLLLTFIDINRRCLPHMRGGVSALLRGRLSVAASSPHAWGCFYPTPYHTDRERVFPTCVGVFLSFVNTAPSSTSLPHMRGGVSYMYAVPQNMQLSSPHAWGCFYHGSG